MDVIDLHRYDRSCKYSYANQYDGSEQQIELIKSIGDKLTDGKDMFDMLINSLGQPNNVDPINGYIVDNLLYDLACIIENVDINILVEQLIDLRSGTCPQGRTLRLIQVLQAYQK